MNKRILSVLFAGILALSPIGIKASTIYATNEDGSKSYTSIDDAWSAAQNENIIMQEDWNLSSRLVLDSYKLATIEMNGHRISRNLTSEKTNGEVIKMCSNSTLILTGRNAPSTYFSFKGYSDGLSANCATTSGGLITGGYSSNGAGAIHMKGDCHLHLDTVSISGNKSNRSWGSDGHGGAIYMNGKDNGLTMSNAEITFNAAQRDGGGIYVNGDGSYISMQNSYIVNNTAGASLSDLDDDAACGGGIAIKDDDVSIIMYDSKIDDNYAHGYGGGIYSNGKNTIVRLGASSISFNQSDNNGGAIYFNYSNFEVVSDYHDSQISHNSALSTDWGGAIYATRCTFSGNSGKIDGITFDSNSAQIGGAMDIHQENVTVSNCTFTNNTAQNGAAISVKNDGFTLENSTVQNNTTTASYSAAVNVDGYNDINLNGTINITQNPNTESGTDADLILTEMGASDAYIVSAPNASSRIGLYIKDDRTLAKNQNSDAPNIYFVNNPNDYSIQYDDSSKKITSKTNEGGGANSDWDEAQVSSHTLTINMVNESGTWQNTQKMSINENEALELQAPVVEDKTFTEFKDVPDALTVENDVVKADSVSEDLELTLVYSDPESEESTDTASIFGDGNTVIAAVIIIGIIVVGAFVFIKKKKQS